MRRILLLSILIFFQKIAYSSNIKIWQDTTVSTAHYVNINNKQIQYTAKTGTIPLWDEKGKTLASIHYTYYKKQGTKNLSKRPLLISFNGGPGSASVWMHIAYTGPYVLNIDEEGNPTQPYGVKKNPYSVLDVADILYVNPINTGYSRLIESKDKKIDRNKFFGINSDIKYLAEWLRTFMTRHNRWLSPKFLIGESYGGTRVAGLALELQQSQWMYLNGVILVSPADYKIFESDRPISIGLNLPYFTAAAWYHKCLPKNLQNKTLNEILPEVEKYTINHVLPAITKGGFIDSTLKKEIAKKFAYYSGLTEKFVLENNLNVTRQVFWKELLREKSNKTIGRLDSRYLGVDKQKFGETPDYNSELTSWLHSFTPAINYYMSEILNYKTDLKYNMFGPVHPWDKKNNSTRENLRLAMTTNPFLNIMVQTGLYDGATTYFYSKYFMWQIDPSGNLKNRMYFKTYSSGHMMYLRKKDLQKANEHVRDFINKSINYNTPAKY